MAHLKIFILKSVAPGQLMGYILDWHQYFSTILLVTMLFIAMIRAYIATNMTIGLPLYQECKCL